MSTRSPSRSSSSATELPACLAPVAPDRDRIAVILDLLQQPGRADLRADLAGELVRFGARYEDVLDRAVGPALEATEAAEPAARLAQVIEASRAALDALYARLRHLKPMNAAVDDPEGFDADLDRAVQVVGQQLAGEPDGWWSAVDGLDGPARSELSAAVERAVAHASTHPHPPHGPVGRVIAGIEAGLSGPLDTATVEHPGRDRLADELDRRGLSDDPEEGDGPPATGS